MDQQTLITDGKQGGILQKGGATKGEGKSSDSKTQKKRRLAHAALKISLKSWWGEETEPKAKRGKTERLVGGGCGTAALGPVIHGTKG